MALLTGMSMLRRIGSARFFRAAILVVLPFLLAACGGGSSTNTEPMQNQPPVFAAMVEQTVETPNELSFVVSATDPDGLGPPALSAAGIPEGASFIDNLDGTGTFRWIPTNADASASPFEVIFSATDTAGATTDEKVIINVLIGNRPPVFDAIPDQAVVAPYALHFQVSATDPDGPPPLTLSANGLPAGAEFVDNLDGTGTFAWMPTNEDAASSPFVVAFDATDGDGAMAIETVAITVEANQPPTLAVPDDLWIAVDEPVSFEVTAKDPDGPPPLTLSASGMPPGAEFADNVDGTGTFSWTPAIADIASSPHQVTFTATDGNEPGLTGTATVELNVSLTEQFESGADGWVFVDNVPDRPGSWEVIDGELHQQNRVERLRVSFDGSYHLGTYAYLETGLALSDYRFNVDAVSLASERAEDLGIMFRYEDDDNYYRLSVNGKYGFTRLERKVDGVFSPLAVNGRGDIHGQSIRYTIDVTGNQIQVWINEEAVFAVEDDALPAGTIALYTQDKASFGNVTISGPSPSPSITIATPFSHTVSTSDPIQAKAVAPRLPSGSEAEFRLGSAPPVTDVTPPFQVLFPAPPAGDYVLEVILQDGAGRELARDTNSNVGVNGEYLIAIGDSITNGFGDFYSRDNRSQSGRILANRGYQANLVDLLDASLQRPVIVYNAGFSGDQSAATIQRVESILARHPGSTKALVMLGTNDSNSSVPSGSGCSGSACTGTFKGNMKTIVGELRDAGKSVLVARIPPVFGNRTTDDPSADPLALQRNQNIQEYNSVIVNELEDIILGPDFFSFFLSPDVNRVSLFHDMLHPNSLGYAVMANLWQQAIDPLAPVSKPFVLDNLTPSVQPPYIKQNLLEAGNAYYVDRDYVLAAIPEILVDGIWVVTANDQADDSGMESISFDVDRSVRVFVAYDAGASALPGWMSDYQDTGVTIATTNPGAPSLQVFHNDYPEGRVTLGANMADGAAGASANYVVVVRPLEELGI